MPPAAYALVVTFVAISVALGFIAVRIVARPSRPPRAAAYVLPVLAAFAAFYLIGHRLGLSVGPEVRLYGFDVALLGDAAIGGVTALVVAATQAAVARRRPAR